jgi:hypothetical protein
MKLFEMFEAEIKTRSPGVAHAIKKARSKYKGVVDDDLGAVATMSQDNDEEHDSEIDHNDRINNKQEHDIDDIVARLERLESEQNTGFTEDAPPGMEDWITKRKPEFKKRYGDKWEEVLYATAWKQHNNESKSNNNSFDTLFELMEQLPAGADEEFSYDTRSDYQKLNKRIIATWEQLIRDVRAGNYSDDDEMDIIDQVSKIAQIARTRGIKLTPPGNIE